MTGHGNDFEISHIICKEPQSSYIRTVLIFLLYTHFREFVLAQMVTTKSHQRHGVFFSRLDVVVVVDTGCKVIMTCRYFVSLR